MFRSLAQEFIFSHLAESVVKFFDSMNVHLLKEAAGSSSHVPFLFILKRQTMTSQAATDDANSETSSNKNKNKKRKSAFCFFKENLDIVESKSSLNGVSMDKCWNLIHGAQDAFKMTKLRSDLSQLKPGRLESIELWMESNSNSGGRSCSGGGGNDDNSNLMKSKYTLTILDVNDGSVGGNGVSVSAFIVPQGREHEFLFSSEDGLKQIAESASCSRLLSFALNRGHVFHDLDSVKLELNQTVIDFSPKSFKGRIPFITTQDGAGVRNAIDEGRLSSGDDYIVEEAEIEGRIVRRLVFMTSSNVIQTEMRLLPISGATSITDDDDDDWGLSSSSKSKTWSSTNKKKSGNKKNKKTDKKKNQKVEGEKNVPLKPTSVVPSNITSASGVDYTYMCFDYHRAIIAGVLYLFADSLLAPSSSSSCSNSTERSCGVVIGLGGGALPMMLHHFFSQKMRLQVAELDQQVYEIAKQWFGFKEDECMKVELIDGLLMDMGNNKQTFVVLDVDSKDSSVLLPSESIDDL